MVFKGEWVQRSHASRELVDGFFKAISNLEIQLVYNFSLKKNLQVSYETRQNASKGK